MKRSWWKALEVKTGVLTNVSKVDYCSVPDFEYGRKVLQIQGLVLALQLNDDVVVNAKGISGLVQKAAIELGGLV